MAKSVKVNLRDVSTISDTLESLRRHGIHVTTTFDKVVEDVEYFRKERQRQADAVRRMRRTAKQLARMMRASDAQSVGLGDGACVTLHVDR